jgi:hypothetical protein
LDNEQQQYQSATTSPYAALNGYMGVIGSNNWGSNSTGTSDTTSTPLAWDTISGLMSSGGLMQGFAPKPPVMSTAGDLGAGTGGLQFPMFR